MDRIVFLYIALAEKKMIKTIKVMASFYDVTAERYLTYQVYTIFQENPRSMNAEKMYLSFFHHSVQSQSSNTFTNKHLQKFKAR